jgi:alkanesulfonate monooxygenase SsuD/methylene tetrahydromethanopterin reductase-like flavin-dependent oxidoreductase (luciferase family)
VGSGCGRGYTEKRFALRPDLRLARRSRDSPCGLHLENIGQTGPRLERIRAEMRFGIFYEHQNPRPWEQQRSEHALIKDALTQVELADRLGFDYVWEVEHHFLEEYSHSSAPEVFLAAAAARTQRIRLGHGIVQIPPAVNHPARVAERVATLDLVSDGRVDFGTGESSSAAELGGFLIDRTRKREMWEDAMDAIARMFVEEPFAGWDSEFWSMPPRNVVPKPLQKPHPPLWVACSRRETIQFAARNGIGALSFSFVEPEDAGHWVEEYYALIESDECVPVGFSVNPAVAVVLPMMLHEDEATAIDRGIDGAHFFGYSLAHYYGMGQHQPGRTVVWDEFLANRDERGFARSLITPDAAPLAVKIMQHGLGSLRGAIGTPEQVLDLCKRYEAVGVDQVIFVLQAGPNRHDDICESLELFAKRVMPEFTLDREHRERTKREQLTPAVTRALARRSALREPPAAYLINEQAELERAARARREGGLRHRLGELATEARRSLQHGGQEALARLVRGASDEQLERRFGSDLAQRAIFTGMARQFEPKFAFGFEGDIAYELSHHGNGKAASRWTVRVRDGAATVVPGVDGSPAVTFKLSIPDFARLIAEEVEPQELLFSGRFDVAGDLTLATRVPEMFGAPPRF